METVLVFLAIVAIQILAAYSKQKKEAAKRAANKPMPMPSEPTYEEYEELSPEEPEETDPFREIRKAMGLPPVEKPINLPPEPPPQPQPQPVRVLPAVAPQRFEPPPQHARALPATPSISSYAPQISSPTPQLSNLAQGIIWATILQEPRHRKKWKPLCSP